MATHPSALGAPAATRADTAVVLGAAVFGAIQLLTALSIVVAPHSFFDSVGAFGAYNSHYLGDVAAFQGGMGIALLASLRLPALRAGALAVTACATGLHAFNHWLDVGDAHAGSSAGIVDAVSLTIAFAFAVFVTRAAMRTGG